MVIVMRTDLSMRKGKMVAQGGHAAVMPFINDGVSEQSLVDWVSSGMKKICVGVESEQQLQSIADTAKVAGLPVFLVNDAGHTEFYDVPTLTCLSIGPADDAAIDAITGGLKLL